MVENMHFMSVKFYYKSIHFLNRGNLCVGYLARLQGIHSFTGQTWAQRDVLSALMKLTGEDTGEERSLSVWQPGWAWSVLGELSYGRGNKNSQTKN